MEAKSRPVEHMEDGPEMTEKYQELFDNIHYYSCISFALVMVKEVGILDTLLKADKSMTSQEIADSKGLKERYTRELLASLVAVKMVKASINDNGLHVYHLEEAAKKVLTDTANYTNILKPLVLSSSYDNVKKCIPVNGPLGVGYTDKYYERINLIDSDDEFLHHILKNVPELATRLEKGIRVLEMGSGGGSFIGKLARKYPNSAFTASEMSAEFEADLKDKLGHLPNMQFSVLDLCCLPQHVENKFDWILMKHATHVVPHPGESLKGIRRMVAETDGILTFIDFVGSGDPLKSIGNMYEAATFSFSLLSCIPLSFLEDKDSEAHGCCWSTETAMKLTREANFEVAAFPCVPHQALFVAKPI